MRAILLAFCLFLGIASPSLAESDKTPPVNIVASFSILADMIQAIGGAHVVVQTLVPRGADPHDFQPAPKDAQMLTAADIIAINGLSFEGWMGRLIKASGTKANLLVASAGVTPRFVTGHDHHDHQPKHKHEEPVPDPHAWQSLRNGELYIKNIASALIAARPDHAGLFKSNARAYITRLKTLDETARTRFSAIPKERRKLITTHDAFGYFAQEYDLSTRALRGLSTHDEPTPQDMAKLVDEVRKEGIGVFFLEDKTDQRLMKQLAQDTGSKIGGILYAESLTDAEGPAPTYIDMMAHNIKTITDGL